VASALLSKNPSASSRDPGGNGREISLADLPPRDTTRWVSRRKATVVAAVHSGLITLDDACRRYRLSVEEYLSWERTLQRHGVPGLRITHAQDYRDPGTN
jgi:hypothetical protein